MADKSKNAESARHRTEQGEVPRQRRRHIHWAWPLGLAIAGMGGAATFLLRGCWHTHMSWPVKLDEEFSYQVCTGCGIKRLYDETRFHAYGPYGYDLHELIARERAARLRRRRRDEELRLKTQAARSAAGREQKEPESGTGTE
jgi:hypothetical protein